MALVKVFSKCVIGQLYSIIENGQEIKVDIKGMNAHQIGGHLEPRMTEVDELIFNKIKDKYKSHLKLFGGVDANGLNHEALIFVAKNQSEAKKIADDSQPVVKRDSDIMVTKTKDIKKYNASSNEMAV